MSPRVVRSLACLLLTAGCPAADPAGTAEDDPPPSPMPAAGPLIRPDVRAAIDRDGRADVVIVLREPGEGGSPGAKRAAIDRRRDAVLGALGPGELELHRRYALVPALAGSLDAAGLARLAARPDVAAIRLDQLLRPTLEQAVPCTGAADVHRRFGFTGRGVRVAILDTGIVTDHPDLADSIVAQHCFTRGACPPDGAWEGDSAEDDRGHGTMVAGVVTANGIAAGPGFAPDAEIVAVRVFGSSGGAYGSDILAGLDWVLAHQDTLRVRAVNMSLGSDPQPPGVCDEWYPDVAWIVRRLNAAGIVVFASSGNDGSGSGVGSPACNSGIVAVAAMYDADLGREPDRGHYYGVGDDIGIGCYDDITGPYILACFSNTGRDLDLVAPGAWIRSTGLRGYESSIGTSFASPAAAGVAALLFECDPDLTPAEVEDLLESTGRPVGDPHSGLTFPGVDALAAVTECARRRCAGLADGTPCDDGSACTRSDVCRGGTCVGEDEVTCPAADACREAGVCDPGSGTCRAASRADGRPCDDGDGCTRTDSCRRGVCFGDDPVVCRSFDECHRPGSCDPATGACSDPPVADGTACTSGTCEAGVCTPPAEGCGCRATGRTRAPWGLAALLAGSFLFRRRRPPRR